MLPNIAANIKKKIRLCRSVISSTSIADVNGLLVMPVRKATIPVMIRRLVLSGLKLSKPEIAAEIEAPMLNDGAKTPPAAPELKHKAEPTHFPIGTYHSKYLSEVNKDPRIISLPGPAILWSKNMAMAVIMIEMAARNNMVLLKFNRFLQVIKATTQRLYTPANQPVIKLDKITAKTMA